MIVCASCYYEGSFPLILTSSDFSKKSVLDFLTEDGSLENDKKKSNIENKVAEAIEKHKFNINKTAEQLKMSPEQIFNILMCMPIQKLEKISRIEAETDVEVEEP
jgi:hypothetical protein